MIEMDKKTTATTISADFEAVRTHLEGNQSWGADLLEQSGASGWRVSAARLFSKGPFGAQVIVESPDQFVAWGITGRKSCLAYRIEREGVERVRVTPLGYLERVRKVMVSMTLALAGIVPVLLSPLIWWLYESQTLRDSQTHLPAFCRLLEKL